MIKRNFSLKHKNGLAYHYLVLVRQVIVVFHFGEDDEATKIVSFLVAFIAVVLPDALVELGALARPAGVTELVESKRSLESLTNNLK